jgi:hypothetical protein
MHRAQNSDSLASPTGDLGDAPGDQCARRSGGRWTAAAVVSVRGNSAAAGAAAGADDGQGLCEQVALDAGAQADGRQAGGADTGLGQFEFNPVGGVPVSASKTWRKPRNAHLG